MRYDLFPSTEHLLDGARILSIGGGTSEIMDGVLSGLLPLTPAKGE